MRSNVKAPLRPFEYMKWAKTVPKGARFDLTASGMDDTLGDAWAEQSHPVAESFREPVAVADMCRRDVSEQQLEALTTAVADRYGVEPGCVTLSLGASLSIMHVLVALIRGGDHVIVERPTYEALHRAPEILGARVSRLERKFDESWRVVPDRLAQLLTSRTRAVILTNLHNPTGVAIDPASMNAVIDLATRVGAMVLVDEVYLDYGWGLDDACVPICRAAQNGISWSSTTKAFGFSALRSGWIVTRDPDAARAIRSATDYLHVYPPVATMALGRRVLEHADALVEHARAISARGQALVERWLEGESRLAWVAPTAGINGCIRLPHLMQDVPFCEHLRERYDTQVVPGTMFEAPGFVRLGFGVRPAVLEEGLANFSAALDDLG